ncbi:hypothetical protein LIER_04920 [Lithospermum erythrorhizon]|uniref:Dehydrin n=1 Tax=Lithospermum erythrorhizon TaxID=34254 RepID=A0AAV3NYI1_LITER
MAEHDQTIKQEEYATLVESQDRGLFDFMGKKVEEKKPEEETISHEFEHKVHVTEPEHKVEEEHKEEEKHEGLIQKLTRSDSNSSSSSEEEVEENGEKKKKKKLKDKIKEKISGDDKEEEKRGEERVPRQDQGETPERRPEED